MERLGGARKCRVARDELLQRRRRGLKGRKGNGKVKVKGQCVGRKGWRIRECWESVGKGFGVGEV